MRALALALLLSGCAVQTPSATGGAPGTCVVDPADGVAKECVHLTAGSECVHFGGVCASSDAEPCVVDPDDGAAKTCYHVTADGSCAHFGGLCTH